jgi:plasmid stability protein
MRHLTVRNLPPELGKALEREKRRRGASLNATVIDLLRQSLGVRPGGGRRNGLARLAGAWSPDEHARFEAAIADLERVDPDLWR